MVFSWVRSCSVWLLVIAGVSAGNAAEPAKRNEVRTSKKPDVYLSLTPGDTWVYARTGVGKQVLGWGWVFDVRGEDLLNQRFQTIQTGKTTPDAEKSEETYKVINRITIEGQDAWEVSVDPENARDQRYQGKQKVLWSIGTDPLVKAPEYWYQERIYKRVQDWADGGFKKKDCLLTNRFLLVPAEGASELKIGVGASQNPEFTSGKRVTVTVPAGRYENCLEVTTVVKSGPLGKEELWTINTYFARNVGMVKEIQLSPSGELAYSLELKSFKRTKKPVAKK